MLDRQGFTDLFIYDLANNHQGDLPYAKEIVAAVGKVNRDAGVRGALKFQFRQLDTFVDCPVEKINVLEQANGIGRKAKPERLSRRLFQSPHMVPGIKSIHRETGLVLAHHEHKIVTQLDVYLQ